MEIQKELVGNITDFQSEVRIKYEYTEDSSPETNNVHLNFTVHGQCPLHKLNEVKL